jgi:2-enoate reductase
MRHYYTYEIGSITVKNRIVLCAMGGTNPSALAADLKRKRARIIWNAPKRTSADDSGVTSVKGMMGESWLYEAEELFMGRYGA